MAYTTTEVATLSGILETYVDQEVAGALTSEMTYRGGYTAG
tara:strand:- start:7 stop:129 length:123 start_codon:yes stop_codon:yes gene_type:complete